MSCIEGPRLTRKMCLPAVVHVRAGFKKTSIMKYIEAFFLVFLAFSASGISLRIEQPAGRGKHDRILNIESMPTKRSSTKAKKKFDNVCFQKVYFIYLFKLLL